MLNWEKLGLVWAPNDINPIAAHSALQPTPILISDDLIRVFVGCRDEKGVSRIFAVDLDAYDPTKVLGVQKNPVLGIGEPGHFDENGVVPCAIIRVEDRLRLYYAGYMCPSRVRFIAFSGAAESADQGLTFKRISNTPVLERSTHEPLFRAIHSILREGSRYRCWYGAGDKFIGGVNKTLPSYNIRYLESIDGISFPSQGKVAIDVEGDEYRVGRPCVVRGEGGQYFMFYGYGSESSPYKLGLALSKDGSSWKRIDAEVGLNLSSSGWDSEMIAYPSILKTKSNIFMFYNGNDYGRSGFGVAKLKGELIL